MYVATYNIHEPLLPTNIVVSSIIVEGIPVKYRVVTMPSQQTGIVWMSTQEKAI